jgi:hypothetical protein
MNKNVLPRINVALQWVMISYCSAHSVVAEVQNDYGTAMTWGAMAVAWGVLAALSTLAFSD